MFRNVVSRSAGMAALARPMRAPLSLRRAARATHLARSMSGESEFHVSKQGQMNRVFPAGSKLRGPVVEGTRSTLAVAVSHEPGSLERVLRLFWKHDLNMTRIESKPRMTEYVRHKKPKLRVVLADLFVGAAARRWWTSTLT